MKKRSSYRPRHVLVNPLAYVIEGVKPVTQHDSFLVDLKIKNHGAMTALVQGRATRRDMDTIIAMSNMVEALWTLGFGKEYTSEVAEGRAALIDVSRRGLAAGKFILRASEMAALNLLMDLHDAQMEVITVRDMERGLDLVKKTIRAGKAERITA